MPGREDGIETKIRTNASYLNSESYSGEEEVVITFRVFRKLFLSMINMEQDKEAIREDETETRSDEIKHFYCVHHLQNGVATFVQGTVVLGDLGPRGQMSKGQLSKEILVRGDFCPRKLLPVILACSNYFFLFSIGYCLMIK